MKLKSHVRFCNSDGNSAVITDYNYLTVQVQLILLRHNPNMVFGGGICGGNL